MEDSPISRHVAKVLRIYRDSFPDLFFGELLARHLISLAPSTEPIRAIRLRSTTPSVLHLHHIEVFTQALGVSKNVAPEGVLAVSSVWPGTDYLLHEQTFLNQHGHLYGFHTLDEEHPWAVVSFPSAVPIEQIVIFNRADDYSSRARSLAVDLSFDGREWCQIYSHPAREAEFQSCLLAASAHSYSDGLSISQRFLLDTILTSLLRYDYQAAEQALQEADPEPSIRRQILIAMNEHVVNARNMQWINHGVRRTFRYWTLEEIRKYLRDAVELVQLLGSSGTKYDVCLGYGAILSLVRDHVLMPHDDDLDILICTDRSRFSDLAGFIDEVSTYLRRAGYTVDGDFVSHRHVYREGMESVDLFFGFQEGRFVSWHPGPRRLIQREEMFPPIPCSLMGVEVSIPRNPYRYIPKVYGDDWAKPQPFWNHAWEIVDYEDWF